MIPCINGILHYLPTEELEQLILVVRLFDEFCYSAPFGIGIFAETLVRLPSVSPHLARVCDLRLVSQTASSLVVLLVIWLALV